jgi:cell wall-associated NlpC family hydrolase
MSLFTQTLRTTCCFALALAAWTVQAAPEKAPKDDMTQFLIERGLAAKAQVSQVAQSAGNIVVSAMGYLGLPYKRGGNTFETGFDCSGFVKALYEQTLGKVLPRSAAEQAAQTTQIDKTELQPGDLVFFNTMRRAFSHVGIYIGEGKFIHSPKPGAQVRIEDMNVNYWATRFNGARRVDDGANPLALNPK